MKAYAYVSTYLDTGRIVKIRSEDGWLLNCFETRLYKSDKIQEAARKFCPKEYDLEWIDDPNKHAGLRIMQGDYEKFTGVTIDGREIKERWSF